MSSVLSFVGHCPHLLPCSVLLAIAALRVDVVLPSSSRLSSGVLVLSSGCDHLIQDRLCFVVSLFRALLPSAALLPHTSHARICASCTPVLLLLLAFCSLSVLLFSLLSPLFLSVFRRLSALPYKNVLKTLVEGSSHEVRSSPS